MGKVKQVEKLDEDAKKAVKWLAAEFEYAQKLIAELEEIRNETDSTKAVREAKQAISIFRWIGRGERRTNRYIQRVISELKKLGTILPPTLQTTEEKFSEQLRVAENTLVKFGSRSTSAIKSELNKIRKDESLLTGLKKHPEIIQNIKNLLPTKIDTVEKQVKELATWIEACQAILKGEVEPFVRKLQQLAA